MSSQVKRPMDEVREGPEHRSFVPVDSGGLPPCTGRPEPPTLGVPVEALSTCPPGEGVGLKVLGFWSRLPLPGAQCPPGSPPRVAGLEQGPLLSPGSSHACWSSVTLATQGLQRSLRWEVGAQSSTGGREEAGRSRRDVLEGKPALPWICRTSP